jgi:SWI/SNF-related matrix-associated actin-dependent regulator of chromatin subfamily A member 5
LSKVNRKKEKGSLDKTSIRKSSFSGGTGSKKRRKDSVSDEDDYNTKEREFVRLDRQPAILQGGQLREHQIIGLNWLISLYELGVNGILADEMGLGKTIQAIAFLGYLLEAKNIAGKHLIVCPNSVMGNWAKEFKKWLPNLRVVKLIARKEFRHDTYEKYIKTREFDVCLTSYEGVNICKAELKRIHWKYVIVDEAHRLKNDESLLSKNLRELNCDLKLLMTGTPLQNNIKELWSLLNFIMPDLFDSSEIFEVYLQGNNEAPSKSNGDIVAEGDGNAIKEEIEKKNEEFITALHRILRPFILKRTKEVVAQTLPPKKEVHVYSGLTEMQVNIYRSILLKRPIVDESRSSMNILMELRKCCNHPYLFDGIEDPTLDPMGEHLIQTSGKLSILDKLLKKLFGGHQVLVFSQFTSMLDILEDYLRLRGYEYCRIDGSTFIEDRETQIEEFVAPGSSKFVFLLSTRAGGLGINLYTADTVVIYDSDWNPQVDLQAMDRAHRIGQKNVVMVYRLITESTVEEKIIERQKVKLKWDSLVLARGRISALNNPQSKNLSKQELKEIIHFGASTIFKTTGATFKDEDIDHLLIRGEQKAEQMNNKIDDAMNKAGERIFDLAMDSINIYEFAGDDYLKKKEEDENIVTRAIDEDYENYKLKKRLAKFEGQNFNEQNWAGEKGPNRPQRLYRVHEHQFYPDRDRLEDLINKEDKLTPEEEQEKADIKSKGFQNWTKNDFYSFIRAVEKYGRDNIPEIAEHVSKSVEDVEAYCRVFWERMHELPEYDKILKSFEKADKTRAMKLANDQILQEKCQGITNYLDINFEPLFYNKIRSKQFSPTHDKFIIFHAYQVGSQNTNKIRLSIAKDPNFRFDFHFKGQKDSSINKRIQSLLKMISNELEYQRTHKLSIEFDIAIPEDESGEESEHVEEEKTKKTQLEPEPKSEPKKKKNTKKDEPEQPAEQKSRTQSRRAKPKVKKEQVENEEAQTEPSNGHEPVVVKEEVPKPKKAKPARKPATKKGKANKDTDKGEPTTEANGNNNGMIVEETPKTDMSPESPKEIDNRRIELNNSSSNGKLRQAKLSEVFGVAVKK